MSARGVEQPRELLSIAECEGLVLAEDNQQLTDQQFTRITRTLAEPRRVQILREIAAHGNSIALACLLRRHQVSPATLSHHASELDKVDWSKSYVMAGLCIWYSGLMCGAPT
jgi:hypothetical protein